MVTEKLSDEPFELEEEFVQAILKEFGTGKYQDLLIKRHTGGSIRVGKKCIPAGFGDYTPDLWLFRRITITQEMIGQEIALPVILECKVNAAGDTRDNAIVRARREGQANNLALMRRFGCRAAFVDTLEDVRKITYD